MRTQESPTRLFDIVDRRPQKHPRRACFKYRNHELSLDDYRRQCNLLSLSLLKLGLRRGEAVAIISSNRPEWNVIDIAVMQAGGVMLPLCAGLTAEEYVECLQKAAVRFFFIENEELLRHFRLLVPQVETLEQVFLIEGNSLPNFNDLISGEFSSPDDGLLNRRRNLTTADDVCTLVYTGGGTYRTLTHRAMLSDILSIAADDGKRRMAAAGNNALCTRYGRTHNYVCQLAGYTISYTELP